MKTTVEEMDRIRRDFFSDLNERGTTSMYPANQTRFGSLNDQSDVLHAQIFELERQLGRLHPISQ